MSELISMIYASAAEHLFSEAELVDLLRVSRENNIRNGITGMLLYKDGNFIQAIEGKAPAVTQLYQKILRDPRHHNIMLLGKQPISEREFPEWEMGFKHLTPAAISQLEGFSPFLDFTPEYFRENPIRAYIMLLDFKKYM